MFFDNPLDRSNYKPQRMRSSKNLKQAILYGIVGILCLLRFQQLWLFSLLFFACMGTSIWLYIRHKKKEEKIDDIINGFSDECETEVKGSSAARENMNFFSFKERKQRKTEYNKFLSDLENELGNYDDDYDYEESDDYE